MTALPGTISETARTVEPIAGHVLYLAKFGEDPVWRLAQRANGLFEEVGALSTLTPTEALVIAGCIDALIAQGEGQEINVAALVQAYFDADKSDYIEHTVLRALRKFSHILGVLDSGLADLGIRAKERPSWVRAGLYFPDPDDGAAYHIGRTIVDGKDGWDRAMQRAEAYLEHVAGLPASIRNGEVDLALILPSVARGLIGE